MNKITFSLIFIMTCSFVYSQNYNKENIAEYASNGNTYTIDLLKDFGINQLFPFGASRKSEEFIKYENKKSKKIKNKWFKEDIDYLPTDVIYGLTLQCKNFEDVKLHLTNLYGEPRMVKYIRRKPVKEWADEYVFDIPDKYYISIRDNGELKIYALDFMGNISKYDEFTKVGINHFFFNGGNEFNWNGYDKIYLKPAYAYFKERSIGETVFTIEYSGNDWIFLNKIDFLLDNDEVLSYEISPKRKVMNLYGSSYCTEKENLFMSDIDWNKILNSKKTKVKFSGKGAYSVFLMNPIHIYSMKIASYYKDNRLLLD